MAEYNIRAEFIPVNFNLPPILTTKTITTNGVYNAADDGATGYSSVVVCVPERIVNIEPLGITPTTSEQTIPAGTGIDGYAPITVSAVTSSIDSNIKADNIRDGVEILGVTGNVTELNGETLSISPTTSQQSFSPVAPHNGYTSVTVDAVTSSIDSDIKPENIREGVNILGVTGTEHIPEYYIEKSLTEGKLESMAKMINLTGVTEFGDYVLYGAYRGNMGITQVPDLSNITALGEHALNTSFRGCENMVGAVDLSNITRLDKASSLYYAFYGDTGITGVNLSNLTHIQSDSGTAYTCAYAFAYCTGITGHLDLSKLKTIGIASYNASPDNDLCNSMFYGCTGITSVDLSNLTGICSSCNLNSNSYTCKSMFQNCTSLASVNLDSLENIIARNTSTYICSYMFSGTALQTVRFYRLGWIEGASYCFTNFFGNCLSLQEVYFYALRMYSGTRPFQSMLSGCSNVTVHFPRNKSSWGTATDFKNGFGGTNTTILFDLPAANLMYFYINGNIYVATRYAKNDTSTSLGWQSNMFNVIEYWYTSGLQDPQVGDSVYSDAACTTAVSTIDHFDN